MSLLLLYFSAVYESDGVELEDTDKNADQEYKEQNSKRELTNLVCIFFRDTFYRLN